MVGKVWQSERRVVMFHLHTGGRGKRVGGSLQDFKAHLE